MKKTIQIVRNLYVLLVIRAASLLVNAMAICEEILLPTIFINSSVRQYMLSATWNSRHHVFQQFAFINTSIYNHILSRRNLTHTLLSAFSIHDNSAKYFLRIPNKKVTGNSEEWKTTQKN